MIQFRMVIHFTKHTNRTLLLLRLYCSHRLNFEKTKGNVILTPLADVFWADFWDVMVHDTVRMVLHLFTKQFMFFASQSIKTEHFYF